MAELTTFQHNIDCRKEAEEVIELCGEKPQRFWAELARLAGEKLPQPANKTSPTPPAPRRGIVVDLGPSAVLAQELIETIRELAGEVPDRGLEFAESVVARADNIAEYIEIHGDVTAAQIAQTQDSGSHTNRGRA